MYEHIITCFNFVDINDCAPNPCENGGSCVDQVDAFICNCAPGYGGDTCSASKISCLPLICLQQNARNNVITIRLFRLCGVMTELFHFQQ